MPSPMKGKEKKWLADAKLHIFGNHETNNFVTV